MFFFILSLPHAHGCAHAYTVLAHARARMNTHARAHTTPFCRAGAGAGSDGSRFGMCNERIHRGPICRPSLWFSSAWKHFTHTRTRMLRMTSTRVRENVLAACASTAPRFLHNQSIFLAGEVDSFFWLFRSLDTECSLHMPASKHAWTRASTYSHTHACA